MRILKANDAAIAEAARVLRAGGLVAFATETVYGLGADATNASAVARVFAAKGRPRFNPLIAHVRSLDQARDHAALSPAALKLAERFWPGPLTLVAPRKAQSAVCDLACAGLDTIALRVPSHPVAQALLGAFDRPIAAPSANRSGHVSATRATHVAEDLGADVDLILDAEAAPLGIESTIVGFAGDGSARLLRPGAIAREEIEAIVGALGAPGESVAAPGMLAKHYAPRARLRLDAEEKRPNELYLGFGARGGDLNLSAASDLREAAANLYAHLRALDARGAGCIAVAPIPREGLGEAIGDRLARAAARE
ncbi:MAG: threonylcarbamoyl-AMP synthase [Hyphomonadaceae bacterium]|nr:threonylcarbamoyl-AMP synthase [Hyphomonadaceae bacterium]